jgi:hypothetical protein
MTDSRSAVGFDRLPWLQDEPERRARSSRRDLTGWLVAAGLLVAGGAYWLGTRTANEPEPSSVERRAPQSTTVPLPAPQPAQPQVRPDRMPEVVPVPAPTVRVPRPTIERYAPRKRAVAEVPEETTTPAETEQPTTTETESAPVAKAPPVVRPERLTLWPARVSLGASGRLVQIGAFGSRLQAKRGWWHMVRAYPGVRRLPAVVVEARNSHRRPFYRFQIGTTSQAHSEVLCQRMERIRFSCAVVGLPGKRKAVER